MDDPDAAAGGAPRVDPGREAEGVGTSVTAQLVQDAGLTLEQAEYLGIPMAWGDYAALGEDVRGEYIDGRLYVNAPPTGWHQRLCLRLYQQLEPQLPEGYVANVAIGWKPARDEFGPDLVVYRADEYDELTPRYTGMPLLVAEVLSQNVSRDTIVKAHRYARLGLAQYWLVNPVGVIEVLDRDPDAEGLFRVQVRLADAVRQVRLADGSQVTVDPKGLFTR